MVQIDNEKKIRQKIIRGPGFSFKVPKDLPDRSEKDPRGQWGYREFFQTNIVSGDLDPQTNVLFYFWKNETTRPSEKKVCQLTREVCQNQVFSGQHTLEQDEIFPITFKKKPGFILKYRFSHHDPEAEGKANFFVLHNPQHEKVIVLGLVMQCIGNRRLETESMAWMEDQMISTFRFKRQD